MEMKSLNYLKGAGFKYNFLISQLELSFILLQRNLE